MPTDMKSDYNDRIGLKPQRLTRRNLLELAGLAIGGAAFPSPPAFALNSGVQDKSAKPAGAVMNSLSWETRVGIRLGTRRR